MSDVLVAPSRTGATPKSADTLVVGSMISVGDTCVEDNGYGSRELSPAGVAVASERVEVAPIAVRICSELSGASDGSESSGVSKSEVIYMLVELGVVSSTCEGSIGRPAETRSDGEMFVV
jgi:hypothetical protein